MKFVDNIHLIPLFSGLIHAINLESAIDLLHEESNQHTFQTLLQDQMQSSANENRSHCTA